MHNNSGFTRFWTVIIPTGNFPITGLKFVIISAHGLTFLGSLIEALLSDFYMKFWHIFLVGIFCPTYMLYIIGMKETNLIKRLPYGELLDYNSGSLAILGHSSFILGYYFLFTIFWLVLTVCKKLIVIKCCGSYTFPSTIENRAQTPSNNSIEYYQSTFSTVTPAYQNVRHSRSYSGTLDEEEQFDVIRTPRGSVTSEELPLRGTYH